MTLEERVTQNLRAARKQRKLSQEMVAQRAGVSVSYISMLERGRRSPPLETIEVLAKALGIQPIALLGDLSRSKLGARRS